MIMIRATRWHNVLRDVWYAKTRTLLVVLSIAVGVPEQSFDQQQIV
jgi:hypothetical protein